MRGEIAYDCLAVEVANQKLIANNHEKYYREFLSGSMNESKEIPSMEDTALWSSEYFWASLYKPYPGVERKVPFAIEKISEPLDLIKNGDMDAVRQWIEHHRSKLNTQLPLVTGDTLLLHWIKMRNHFLKNFPTARQLAPKELRGELRRSEEKLQNNWHKAICVLAQNAPEQLNVADYKGQTALMLAAEAGDTELVSIMLEAGADPDMRDGKGMTALHSAIKSHVDSCVDALLNHPCSLEKCTHDQRTPLHTAGWCANTHAIKRLLQLAPRLAWQPDSNEMTPLEAVEYFIDNPPAFELLAQELRQNGRHCASKQDLMKVVQLLEQAPSPSTSD